jgi:hypothetical protein
MSLQLSGTSGVLDNSGAFIAGTAVATTSGTSVTFTGIPSWVKRVTISFNNVTLSSGNLQVQVGSGSTSTSGYASQSVGANSGGTGNTSSTSGYVTNLSSGVSGSMVLTLVSGNTWAASGLIGNGGSMSMNAGISPTLGGALDRVAITSLSGSATFSAGTVNILYE